MSASAVMRKLTGIPASPGIAIGRAYLLDAHDERVPVRDLEDAEIEPEVERFQRAIQHAMDDLVALQSRIAVDGGEETAHIFRAHRAVLEDPEVVGVTLLRIRRDRKNAEVIFNDVMQGWITNLSAIQNPYFRERTADFEDIRHRVMTRLRGGPRLRLEGLQMPVIFVAHNLSPSDTAEINREQVCGFITDLGGRTSHTAIVARGLAVPAVVGVNDATKEITPGVLLILDGNQGDIYIDPDEETLRHFEETRTTLSEHERELHHLHDLPATTVDGHTVELSANIELPNEMEIVRLYGADGIGLYRTEFLYLVHGALPTEEDQYQAYHSIAKALAPKPVIIRTLDLGMDKMPYLFEMPHEANPALGNRGIRLCLEQTGMFRAQLRAILRASVLGNLRIMFPMISGLGQLRAARQALTDVRDELDREGIAYDTGIPVGIMIEVPSAAVVARDLAREVDFFSIGTNDLIQYTLAVDRGNAKIAHLYDPFHPAILRLIAMVVDAAHEQGIWVGVCGEMASDPLSASVLVGLGVDELSMSPVNIPELKQFVRSVQFSDLQRVARHLLTLPTSAESLAAAREAFAPFIADRSDVAG